jgi:hypothetical protein
MNTTRRHCRANGRRGFLSLEAALALPILIVLLLGALQYYRLLTLRSGLTQAATVAAREAGKGGDVADVARAINCVLAAYGIAISDAQGSGTKVVLQDGCCGTSEYGDPDLRRPREAALGPHEVLATLCIQFDAKRIDGSRLIVDTFGLLRAALQGKEICVRSLARKAGTRRASAAACQIAEDRTTAVLVQSGLACGN